MNMRRRLRFMTRFACITKSLLHFFFYASTLQYLGFSLLLESKNNL